MTTEFPFIFKIVPVCKVNNLATLVIIKNPLDLQPSLRLFPLLPCFEIGLFPENTSLFSPLPDGGFLKSYTHSFVPGRRVDAFFVILASYFYFQIIPFQCNNPITFSPSVTLLMSHLLSLIVFMDLNPLVHYYNHSSVYTISSLDLCPSYLPNSIQ